MNWDLAQLMKQALEKNKQELNKIEKKSFLLSFLMMGCQGNGGLEYNHFTWGIDKETGDFATTLGEGMVEAHYKTARLEYPEQPEYNKNIDFVHIKISGLKDYLTIGESFFQGRTSMTSYEEIANGNVYDYLESWENGFGYKLSKENGYYFNDSDEDSMELIFVNESGEYYNDIPIRAKSIDDAVTYFENAASGAYENPNVTIIDQ